MSTTPAGPASDSPVPVTPTRRWGLLDAIGSMLAFVAISFGVSILLVFVGVHPVTATLVATPAGWLALGGWPILVTRRFGDGPRRDLGLRFRPVDIGIGVVAGLAILAVAVLFVLVYVAWTGQAPSSSAGDLAQSATQPWQVVVLGVILLGAAFVEELHFRGLWWQALRRRGVGSWLTLLITATLFALLHLEPTRAPLLFGAGLAAGFVRMRTDRLGPAIVTHLFINGLGRLALLSLL